jgi:WD40 repeat protein
MTEAYDAARAIAISRSDNAGSDTDALRERYDWRRGRSSFQTRSDRVEEREAKRREDRIEGDATPNTESQDREGYQGAGTHDRDDTGDHRDPANDAYTSSSCSSSSSDETDDEDDCRDETETNAFGPTVHARLPAKAVDGRTCPVVSVACSGRGIVAIACLEAGVRVWDARTGALLGEHEAFETREEGDGEETDSEEEEQKNRAPKKPSRASDVWWVFDDSCLLAAYDDGGLALWRDVQSSGAGEETGKSSARAGEATGIATCFQFPKRLSGHADRVVSAAWTRSKEYGTTSEILCTAALDATARVWRFQRNVSDSSDRRVEDPSRASRASRVSMRLARAIVLDPDDSAPLTCCSVSSDGTFLATGDTGGVFRVWALPSGALAQSVKWDVHGEDDAIVKCAFLPPARRRTGSSGFETVPGSKPPPPARAAEEGYRFVTAHYSRADDRSRMLAWRVGLVKPGETTSRAPGGETRVATREDVSDWDIRERRFEDRRASYRPILGYEVATPGNGKTFDGRISDAALGTLRDGSNVIALCGIKGWVTVIDIDARGWCTLYTLEGGTRGGSGFGFESRIETRGSPGRFTPKPRRPSGPSSSSGILKIRFLTPGAFATGDGEGIVSVRDAEDGAELCARLRIPGAKGKVWSVSGFLHTGDVFAVAGTADGEAACWKINQSVFLGDGASGDEAS